jgi:hypothetical protein
MLTPLIPLYGDNIIRQGASHENLKGGGTLYGILEHRYFPVEIMRRRFFVVLELKQKLVLAC